MTLDAAIDARIDAKLAKLGTPVVEWVLASAVGLDRRQAKRDAARFKLKIATIGKRTYVHVASYNAMIAAAASEPAVARERDELDRALGL